MTEPQQTDLVSEARELSEADLLELEIRPYDEVYARPFNKRMVRLTVEERDALCQTVRAAWAKYDAEDKDHRLTIGTFRQQERIWNQKFDGQEQENTALREQLAETGRERDAYRGQVVGLNARLAQVEKERSTQSDLKESLIRATGEDTYSAALGLIKRKLGKQP